jgi:hypothetical protein
VNLAILFGRLSESFNISPRNAAAAISRSVFYHLLRRYKQRKRPGMLSITHILRGEEEAEMDISEAG